MRAAVLEKVGGPLDIRDVPSPEPASGEVLVSVDACGVCRTDVHIADGDLPEPKLPLICGHQVVGTVAAQGPGAERFALGEWVGIPWLGWACGECRYCTSGRENLCDRGEFTGYTRDGGFAELVCADERFCLPVPPGLIDDESPVDRPVDVAPLLCAGLIGYRSLRLCGDAERVGLYGFGASAHIVCQIAAHQGRRVHALTRPGDDAGQQFAKTLGAVWAGDTEQPLPEELDAAIIFAPAGELVPLALRSLAKGGSVVCAGIHMSDIPSFAYADLWGERQIRSVANLTRADGEEFLPLAAEAGVTTTVTRYELGEVNDALGAIRSGGLTGAAVLEI
jgi:propanol-preferring alcohol dehydrogenase